MTLTTRLSLLFLAALTMVLAGFSATVYFLAESYLTRQAEDRLDAALNTMVAVVESEPAGLEWDIERRHLVLDQEIGDGPLPWLVTDGQGRRVDGSKAFFSQKSTDSPLSLATDGRAAQVVHWHDQAWLVGERRLERPGAKGSSASGKKVRAFPVLIMKAGVPLDSAYATLRRLARTLTLASAGTLLAS